MRNLLFSLILFVFGWGVSVSSLSAQAYTTTKPEDVGISSTRLQRISKHFQSYVDEKKVAGMQTLIARKGKIVHFESIGYADVKTQKELKEASIFRIYSMSKPIVSVALMMLYEEGKFQLKDPVHKYIPAFKNMRAVVRDDKTGETEEVTTPMKVVDLLRHTSGLGYGWGPRNYVDSVYAATGFWFSKDLEQFTDKVATMPLYFQPGTKWRYGISTDIVGRLVEVLSGQSLDVFLKERIFDPLEMEDTFFGVPADKVNRYTTCYRPTKEGGLSVQDHPSTSRFAKKVSMFSGGGGLQSTSLDYFKFCQMLLNGGEMNGNRLLSPKTIELMTSDHTQEIKEHSGNIAIPNSSSGFGLGFSVTTNVANSGNLGSEGNFGWGGAAGTYFRIDPEEDLIMIQMIQLMPYNHLNHQQEFHTLVYQSIIE